MKTVSSSMLDTTTPFVNDFACVWHFVYGRERERETDTRQVQQLCVATLKWCCTEGACTADVINKFYSSVAMLF